MHCSELSLHVPKLLLLVQLLLLLLVGVAVRLWSKDRLDRRSIVEPSAFLRPQCPPAAVTLVTGLLPLTPSLLSLVAGAVGNAHDIIVTPLHISPLAAPIYLPHEH